MTSKCNVNQIITDRIVERVQTTGELPWQMPWKPWSYKGKIAPAYNLRGTAYHGYNALLLSWLPYQYPIYASFKQVQEMGGKVRKGEKSHIAIFFKMIEREGLVSPNKDRAECPSRIPLLRYYHVFNISQCDGLEGKIPLLVEVSGSGIPDAEKIVQNYKNRPKIVEKAGESASYSPALDTIAMPLRGQFSSESQFYSILYHELVHSTGAENRLNRDTLTGRHRFGSKEYGREELVAEIGACYLCGLAGIEKTADNSAAYLQAWLRNIGADSSLLGWAAAKAQKAYDLITNTANESALPVAEDSIAA